MNDMKTPDIVARDHWAPHPEGRLFAREWVPSPAAGAVSDSPIVLFHDSLGCVELWRDFPAALCAATGRRVIAYDRLGFGRSDARTDRPPLDFVADEARHYFPALREALGFQRFIAFGHSVGGGMAVNCAAVFGADCEALITESAQAFPEDLTLKSIAEAKGQFEDPAQLRRLEKYHGDKTRWVVDAWTENWLHPGFAAWTLRDVLPLVHCPVLAIHGEHDEYGTTCHPRMISELSGGPARVEILPDTYHVPHRERADVIIGMVADFIGRLRHRLC